MLKRAFIVLTVFILCIEQSEGQTYDRRTPIVQAVDKVLPSVVNVFTTKRVQGVGLPSGFFTPFEDLFNRTYQGLGSGVVVEGGYVVTNNHVIAYDSGPADSIYVTFPNDNEQYEVSVVGSDPSAEVAILKLKNAPKSYLPWGRSDDLMIGETVIAIGNALGQPFTVTTGIISALNRTIEASNNRKLYNLIQTNADINRGNSGGPLVNINGEFIGLNTAILSPTGASVGLGFAIPVSRVKKIYDYWVNSLVSLEDRMGLEIQDLDPPIKDYFKSYYPNLSSQDLHGIVVISVSPTGLSNKVLQRRDVIFSVNDREIFDSTDMLSRIEEHQGNQLKLGIIRDGKKQMIQLRVPDKQIETISWAGLELQELDNAWRRWLNLKDDFSGIVIRQVTPNSAAEKAGLNRGDVVTVLNQNKVITLDDLKNVIKTRPSGRKAYLEIIRIVGREPYRGTVPLDLGSTS